MANEYNKAIAIMIVDFSGIMQGAQALVLPFEIKTGPELKLVFNDTKSRFTIAHSRWSRPGQDKMTRPDRTIFDSCCSLSNLEGEPSTMGKRVMIMFSHISMER